MSASDSFKAHTEAVHFQYAQLTAYTNLILGAGYAGFFATWSLTKENLSKSLSSVAGILILVSLFFFVLFEIIRMVYTTIELEKQDKALAQPDQYVELMAEYSRTHTRMAHQLRVVWYIFFSISFGTALCAAGIMVYAFARQLVSGP